jgi:hypothetical protein
MLQVRHPEPARSIYAAIPESIADVPIMRDMAAALKIAASRAY